MKAPLTVLLRKTGATSETTRFAVRQVCVSCWRRRLAAGLPLMGKAARDEGGYAGGVQVRRHCS